ncbi:hypothetical protein CC78DRAFT_587358 [Lojkania enalia]|uniref:Uncharacterized protein n=1 Tax=Lojkania enalia TaxID=147567 RepID=A0A9P4MXH3_9PLEO|nr:hypothetical protein CC78DRAFT_587358 [Didymosphaeria enalia]
MPSSNPSRNENGWRYFPSTSQNAGNKRRYLWSPSPVWYPTSPSCRGDQRLFNAIEFMSRKSQGHKVRAAGEASQSKQIVKDPSLAAPSKRNKLTDGNVVEAVSGSPTYLVAGRQSEFTKEIMNSSRDENLEVRQSIDEVATSIVQEQMDVGSLRHRFNQYIHGAEKIGKIFADSERGNTENIDSVSKRLKSQLREAQTSVAKYVATIQESVILNVLQPTQRDIASLKSQQNGRTRMYDEEKAALGEIDDKITALEAQHNSLTTAAKKRKLETQYEQQASDLGSLKKIEYQELRLKEKDVNITELE